MKDSWINPLRSDQNLISLDTVAMAPTEISNDLMIASKIGDYKKLKL